MQTELSEDSEVPLPESHPLGLLFVPIVCLTALFASSCWLKSLPFRPMLASPCQSVYRLKLSEKLTDRKTQ